MANFRFLPIAIALIVAGIFVMLYPFIQRPLGQFMGGTGEICSETDFGKDPFTFGRITYSIAPNQMKTNDDYCKSDTELVEYYCENGYAKSKIIECSFYNGFCSNGLCVIP